MFTNEARGKMPNQRRTIVGVIGGDDQMDAAVALGKIISKYELILMTGGQLLPRREVEKRGEVKNAALLGAAEEMQSNARLIGILPTSGIHWDHLPSSRRLFLHSGQAHNVRNVINGRTPDAVVVFGGSRGTLAEIAFAAIHTRPLIFAQGSIERLRERFGYHFIQSAKATDNIGEYFEKPLQVYPETAGTTGGAKGLIERLEQVLLEAQEVADLDITITMIVGRDFWRSEETGFPGLPGDYGSKGRFERIVREISQ